MTTSCTTSCPTPKNAKEKIKIEKMKYELSQVVVG